MERSQSSVSRIANLSPYRHEKRKLPLFGAEVERTLCERWREHHDISAAHQLVEKYLYLAGKIAEGYSDCGIPLEELIGEGYVGLMRAVCRFNPRHGARFTTYATWHMRASIHEYMVRTMGMNEIA